VKFTIFLEQFFQIDPSLLKSFDYYKQTKKIYTRTKIALGEMPIFGISYADSKEVRVNDDTDYEETIDEEFLLWESVGIWDLLNFNY